MGRTNVTRVRTPEGKWSYSLMTCTCGQELRLYADEAHRMLNADLWQMPDFHCDICDKIYNLSGQAIAFPLGQGEDYAGERWEDEEDY